MDFSFKTRNGRVVYVPEEYVSNTSMELMGYCLRCGEEREGTEPDAREFPCEACGEDEVFGAQELLMMGVLE